VADSLDVSTSNFRIPLPPRLRYGVEVKYRPYIPDNVKYSKVFEVDIEIKRFLETVDEFSALHIDQDHDYANDLHDNVFLKKIANNHIVKLPSNQIPKGLVPLERIFNSNDVAIKSRRPLDDADISKCNIHTEENPKFVELSSSQSKE